MKKTLQKIKKPTRKPRKHIPALNPDQLKIALEKLEKAPLIPPAAKKQFELMIRAAANSRNEAPEIVIKTLPDKRQKQVQSMVAQLNKQTSALIRRAEKGLDDIPDAEWDRLVEEANRAD